MSDDKYGAAAIDLQSVHDPLKARKAWFFFDREYVCLGAGITSDASYPVVTTLNQCLLNKEVVVKVQSSKKSLKNGNHELNNVSWVLHDGVAYLFPTSANVHISNQTATGNWRQINHQDWATTEPVKKDVFSLWIHHGTKPQNGKYAYIVIPGMEASSVDDYYQRSGIIILANTFEVQAVQHKNLGLTQIVFYKEGTIELSDGLIITVRSPCMVMIKTKGKTIEQIAVSDPARKLKSLELTVNAPFDGQGSYWKSVWNQKKKSSVIHIDLPKEDYAGKTVELVLSR